MENNILIYFQEKNRTSSKPKMDTVVSEHSLASRNPVARTLHSSNRKAFRIENRQPTTDM
jgi:hypothetical protein